MICPLKLSELFANPDFSVISTSAADGSVNSAVTAHWSRGPAMSYCILVLMVCMCAAVPAAASEVTDLADCTKKVFNEINRTRKWSGKPLDGCKGHVAVEKRPGGVFVAAWSVERAEGGWIMTAFSGAMGYAEIADKQALARAAKDITSRAIRLERCLNSILTVNDPLECRDRSTKVYHVSEEAGTEIRRLVWLDDDGRHTVVEYVSGSTSVSMVQPVELLNGASSSP
jgi:hypothetical protein